MQVYCYTQNTSPRLLQIIQVLGSSNNIYNYSKTRSEYLLQELDIQKEMKNRFDKNIKYKKNTKNM